jgi:prophage DNA circulation protein
MNDSTLRYKLYEAAIVAGINSDQYDNLSEGMFDFFKDIFRDIKAGKETASGTAAAIKKLFSDNKNKVIVKEFTQDFNKLAMAASKAGIGREALKSIVDGVFADVSKNLTSGQSPQDNVTSDIKPGTAIDQNKANEAVPALASVAAQIAGSDPEKAKEQVIKNKINVPKATQILAKALENTTRVAANKIQKVIDVLIQHNHMVAESRHKSLSDSLLEARKVVFAKSQIERLNVIAGIITEKDESKSGKTIVGIRPSLVAAIKDIRQKYTSEEISDDELLKILKTLDDLDSIKIK